MYTYEPLAHDDISDAAKKMVELWNTRKEPIVAKFNDIELKVENDVSPESIVEFYETESNRRQEEWLNSPAGHQAMAEAHEQQQKRAAEKTRRFHIGDILSITTGRVLSLKGIDGIYEILNFMTDDSLFTHQLPRECKPQLLKQLPWLDSPEMQHELGRLSEMLDTPSGKAEPEKLLAGWLVEIATRYGEYHMIERMLPHQHEIRSPFDLT